MNYKKITKIQLPIEDDVITPGRPDLSWGLKMFLLGLGFVVVWYILFYAFAHLLVGKISLEQEREYFGDVYIQDDAVEFDMSILQSYSWTLGDPYKIYVQSMWESNAFATLGWNIIFSTELLDELVYEEEFLFILGHEKQHIDDRHVLKWLLTHVPFQITLATLWFDVDTTLLTDKAGKIFDKQLEWEADEWGIEFMKTIWANLSCVTWFFERESNSIMDAYFQLDSGHPLMIQRIQKIQQAAQEIWNNTPCTPFKK